MDQQVHVSPLEPIHRGDHCAMMKALPGIVDGLVRSYHETPDMNHLDGTELPSREAVVRILDLAQQLVFPGYVGKQDLCRANIAYTTGKLVDDLFTLLSSQVARSLIHVMDPTDRVTVVDRDVWKRSEEVTIRFLQRLPDLRAVLREDVQAAYDGDPAAKGFDEIILSYPGLFAIATYRLAHELLTLGVPLLPRIMTEHAHALSGIDIHPGASIQRRFFIDHGTGVVIGETTEIGNNVKLYQGVTLGALSFPKDASGQLIRNQKRHPTIEDDVVVYSSATILGGETVIGKGSVIGGGVWLTRSVPPGTKVLMAEPQLVIKQRREPTLPA